MKRYATYDLATGKVLQTGNIQDEFFGTLGSVSVGVIETTTVLDANAWRVVAGALVALPTKPFPSYIFNYTTGVWEDPRTVEQARSQATQRMTQARDVAAARGFVWNGYPMRADNSTLVSLNSVANAYIISPPAPEFTIAWTTARNQVINLTAAELVDLSQQTGLFVKDLNDRLQLRRQEIEAATDITVIDGIEF
jgi:hypothetical protein